MILDQIAVGGFKQPPDLTGGDPLRIVLANEAIVLNDAFAHASQQFFRINRPDNLPVVLKIPLCGHVIPDLADRHSRSD